MKPIGTALLLATALAAPAQELDQRFGLNLYATRPSDTAGKIYGNGWKVGIPVYFRIGQPVEGRLRVEFGRFSDGKVESFPHGYTRGPSSATTRLVGYDWLIALGDRAQPVGVDLILGIGGARWWRDTTESWTGSGGTPQVNRYTDNNVAFAGTIGFRFRYTPKVALELHQVLTSVPGSRQDFEDAELSHTALGLALRF